MKLKKESALYQILSDVCVEFPFAKIAGPQDYATLLDLIESEGMHIKNIGEVCYSRKPDLLASFEECGHQALVLTDNSLSLFAVISEIELYEQGVKSLVYYTSDLRISKSINWRNKAKIRKAYTYLLEKLDKKCFTAILKSNTRGINALTSKSSNLNYRELFDYRNDIIIANPLLRFISIKNKFDIVPAKEICQVELNNFLEKQQSELAFSHVNLEQTADFVLIEQNEIIASLSLKRPKFRKIYIKPDGYLIKCLFQFSRFFFKSNYLNEIPWVYVTQFLFNKDYEENALLKAFLVYFYKEKILNNGDVLMISHNDKDLTKKLHPFVFQISIESKMYNLSNEKINKIKDGFCLNPLVL